MPALPQNRCPARDLPGAACFFQNQSKNRPVYFLYHSLTCCPHSPFDVFTETLISRKQKYEQIALDDSYARTILQACDGELRPSPSSHPRPAKSSGLASETPHPSGDTPQNPKAGHALRAKQEAKLARKLCSHERKRNTLIFRASPPHPDTDHPSVIAIP